MRDSLDTAVAEAPGRLAFARVNPLEYGEEIKELFVAHERPEFPAFFERTYPDVVADGAASWVGRDEQGRIRAHIAQFPRPFRLGQRMVRGSLLANLMVSKTHRTLWPALALVRQLVNDSRDTNDGALAVLRAVGFRPVGALRRFVLPLTDQRRSVDLGIRLYHLVGRIRALAPLVVMARRASEMPAGPDIVQVDSLGPVPKPAVYRHRLAGYPSSRDWWYSFHGPTSSERPIAAALVRGPDDRGLAVVCALCCEPPTLLRSVLVGLARALRARGVGRLEVSVMDDSPVAVGVRRAGFLRRPDAIPVVAMPLTPLGTEAIAVGAEWRLLPIDLDR